MPAPVSKAAPKPRSSTGWIVGCIVVACLALAIGGIAIFGTGFLSLLGRTTDVPTQTATEVFDQPTSVPFLEATTIPSSTGKILLEDDFSDSNQWGTLTDINNSIEYDGEALRMQMFQKNWYVWSTPNSETYENIHVEVTVTNNDGEPTTSFGIICNKQGKTPSSYYLAMASDGEYAIARAIEGEDDVFLTNNDEWAYSDLIEPNLSTYRVGADCGYGTLTLYVNGKVIASVTDYTYTSGGVGLFAWSGLNVSAGDVTFDDFIMTSLE